MDKTSQHKFYPLPALDFRDFWDICQHYQQVEPRHIWVSYSLFGASGPVCTNESDISAILNVLKTEGNRVRKYVARFHASDEPDSPISAELVYRNHPHGSHPPGLALFCETATKLEIYRFEQEVLSRYELLTPAEPTIEFGRPCEVVAAVIDMRGFSNFCEKPNIESPYICGLMTVFYHTVTQSFRKYPPDLIKFLGDGVLVIWNTSIEDRQIAAETCLAGCRSIDPAWQKVRANPYFSHGSPETVGVGISFGLASRLSLGAETDFIGRPINIASRLCGVCPGKRIYADRSLPGLAAVVKGGESRVRIKSYGEFNIAVIEAYDDVQP